MQVVIDLPEEMWEQVKDGYVPLGISKYLKNGTPLRCVLDKIRREIKEYTFTAHGTKFIYIDRLNHILNESEGDNGTL